MENIKLHDTVMIKRTIKDRERSYYDKTFYGVVVELGEKTMSIKDALSERQEFNITLDSEYTYEISEVSELDFVSHIDEQLDIADKRYNEATEKYNDILRWKKQYKFEITLLGKLSTFMKHYV